MNKHIDIEAALERSLRKQVKAPRLDGRFDAAVWSRIEAAQQPVYRAAQLAAPSASARWLFIINAIGGAVALALVAYFGWQSFGGADVSVPSVMLPAVSVPEVSDSTLQLIVRATIWTITGVSLVFGSMFTSLGRRVQAELRQFL
ncbi:MAG: hypothetical protein ABI821_13785 [Pseudomonadota bacterium]